jgi:hypothetical protein
MPEGETGPVTGMPGMGGSRRSYSSRSYSSRRGGSDGGTAGGADVMGYEAHGMWAGSKYGGYRSRSGGTLAEANAVKAKYNAGSLEVPDVDTLNAKLKKLAEKTPAEGDAIRALMEGGRRARSRRAKSAKKSAGKSEKKGGGKKKGAGKKPATMRKLFSLF